MMSIASSASVVDSNSNNKFGQFPPFRPAFFKKFALLLPCEPIKKWDDCHTRLTFVLGTESHPIASLNWN